MWQAPALTIAGQAFLLQVITNAEVGCAARAAVLVAGLVALTAAIKSLRQVLKREREYSERIKKLFRAKGSEVPTPPQEASRPVLCWWIWALYAFAIADVVAFFVVAI